MPRRYNQKKKKVKAKKKTNTNKNKGKPTPQRHNNNNNGGGGGPNKQKVVSDMAAQLEGLDLESILSNRPDPSLRGPADEDRQFPKPTDEQIDRFLADGTFGTSDEESGGKDNNNNNDDDDASFADSDVDDSDLNAPLEPMPEPRPMDDVYGAAGGIGDTSDSKALLAKMLDPNAGGKGNNQNGLSGLVAPERSDDPRKRLRQKLRAMRRRRGAMGSDDVVRDARGRKIPGARAFTMEDMAAGLGPRNRNMQVDRSLTAQRRKEILEKLKADMAAKQSARLAGAVEATTS